MSTWKCILCGTTIVSKCPGHRTEFYDHELSLIRSVVTVDRVDYAETRLSDLSELVLTYTAPSELSTAQQVRHLAEMLTKEGVIEAMTCSHYWVMNSETERRCCLDHEHSNLTDAARLLAEHDADKTKPTLRDTVRALARIACTPIESARKAINCSKPTYDSFIEAEFGTLKNFIQHAVEELYMNRTFRPAYRVVTNGPSTYEGGGKWTYADGGTERRYAYFDREKDAVAFAEGRHEKLDIEMLNLDDDSGYRSIQYELVRSCEECHELLDLTQPNVSGRWHPACFNKVERNSKVKLQLLNVPLPHELDSMRTAEGHDYFDECKLEREVLKYIESHSDVRPVLLRGASVRGYMPTRRGQQERLKLHISIECSTYDAEELVRMFKDVH